MAYFDRLSDAPGPFHPVSHPDHRLIQAAVALLSDHGQLGGLAGLRERFQEAGLGRIFASWTASGANLPVTPEQLRRVLGLGALQQIAEETALDQEEVLVRLVDMLPDLTDRLTPEGRLPVAGLGDVASLLARVMKA